MINIKFISRRNFLSTSNPGVVWCPLFIDYRIV